MKIQNINNLHQLLESWKFRYNYKNFSVTGISLDSREVFLGNLFLNIQKDDFFRKKYLIQALNQGAYAILLESKHCIYEEFFFNGFIKIPIIYFNDLKRYLSKITGKYYCHPSRMLSLVGVTGTNGKTTVTHLLTHWVQLLGEKSAVMGTLGNGTLDNIFPSNNTTCSSIVIQKTLFNFLKNNIKFVAMEVSSHGLAQNRVDSLYFDAAVFTNLHHDHLDYHGNMQEYERAKWKLFNKLHVNKIIINVDDPVGYKWLSSLSQATAVTIKNNIPSYWKGKIIRLIKAFYSIYGTQIIFDSTWGKGCIFSNLLGSFNVSNLLLALGTLLELGYSLSELLNTASKLKSICGRMEIFKVCGKPLVIVDYAHNPNSLMQVLIFSKKYYQKGKLWCVFGCGGNRDSSKRALMGKVAEKYADRIIITNDNPRHEEPQKIVDDIISCIINMSKVQVIFDRSQAINTAIFQADIEDLILISGKGHETYQIVDGIYLNYSDRQVVKDLFQI